MSHLSDTASVARKSIKYGSVGIVALIILRVAWNAGLAWWKARHPDPPPPPDVAFGKLPSLHFPAVDQPALRYTLETPTGGLPKLDSQFTVYFMPIKKPNLLAYDEATKLAARLDFIREPQRLSETEYRWDASSPIPSSFTIDVITGEFVYDRRWQDDESYRTPSFFISEDRAADVTRNFLARLELLSPDIRTGPHTIQYLKVENDQLASAISLSKSQFIRVNLFRSPVEGISVVNPLVDKGLISAIIALQREDNKQFVRVEYSYFPVELEQKATYPLTGLQTAWQRLQEGSAFIATIGGGVEQVAIRDIFLAYYDSDEPQQFLQPVYVFEGDSGFTAYVPAIADEWIE